MGPKLNIDLENADFVSSDSATLTEKEVEAMLVETNDEVEELQDKVSELMAEVSTLNLAISILKKYIADSGLPPYNPSTLEKAPKEMTREELIERNRKSSSARIAKSAEALPQPSFEDTMKLYSSKRDQHGLIDVLLTDSES